MQALLRRKGLSTAPQSQGGVRSRGQGSRHLQVKDTNLGKNEGKSLAQTPAHPCGSSEGCWFGAGWGRDEFTEEEAAVFAGPGAVPRPGWQGWWRWQAILPARLDSRHHHWRQSHTRPVCHKSRGWRQENRSSRTQGVGSVFKLRLSRTLGRSGVIPGCKGCLQASSGRRALATVRPGFKCVLIHFLSHTTGITTKGVPTDSSAKDLGKPGAIWRPRGWSSGAGREGLPWQLRPGLPMQIQPLAGD